MSLLGLASTIIVATADPAEAARRRRHVAGGGYNPPYAALVVDAKTGQTLHAVNPDALRHPASITKVMTLYLLFERLEQGKLRLDSELRISAHAARQSPSKLGLPAGSTISAEDAIKALVTKSANDIAVTIAENLAGSEPAFAELMTRKAQSLGMHRTVFVNASGLPAVEQVTTARDLVTLGRAIQDRFPHYYAYFGTRSFRFEGAAHANHNKLLGRVEGVDGIKTGFTRMSGFNLLTSAKSDGRHIVAAVLGGKSGRSRDAIMAQLVEANLPRAYAGRRTIPTVAEAVAREAPAEKPVPVAAPKLLTAAAPAPAAGKPLDLKSVVRPVVATATGSDVTPGSTGKSQLRAPTPPILGFAARDEMLRPPAEIKTSAIPAAPPARIVAWQAPVAAKPAPVEAKPSAAPAAAKPVETRGVPSEGGWVIQLGATDERGAAEAVLAQAKAKAGTVLAKAKPFTEAVHKGGTTLWRARFAGFDSDDAQAACKTLKRGGFSCFATRS